MFHLGDGRASTAHGSPAVTTFGEMIGDGRMVSSWCSGGSGGGFSMGILAWVVSVVWWREDR